MTNVRVIIDPANPYAPFMEGTEAAGTSYLVGRIVERGDYVLAVVSPEDVRDEWGIVDVDLKDGWAIWLCQNATEEEFYWSGLSLTEAQALFGALRTATNPVPQYHTHSPKVGAV